MRRCRENAAAEDKGLFDGLSPKGGLEDGRAMQMKSVQSFRLSLASA